MDTNTKDLPKKAKRNPYYIISILLLVFVLIVTGLLWFFDNSLVNNIENNNSKINEYNKKIWELKTNSNILSYDIMNNTKQEVESSIIKSEANLHIEKLLQISRVFNVQFVGFTFDWEKISTTANVSWVQKLTSMQVASDFIKACRSSEWLDKTKSDYLSWYTLGPVTSIWWNELKRTFDVSLTLK